MRLREWLINGALWLSIGVCCGVLSAGQKFSVEVIHDEAKPVEQVAADKPYFIMFSGSFCDPCRRMKATELPKLLKSGYQTTVIMVDSKTDPMAEKWQQKYGVTRLPTIFLLDRKTRKTLKGPYIGFTSAITLISDARGRSVMAPAQSLPNRNARLTCPEIRALVRSKYQPGRSLNADVSPQSMVWGHLTDGSGGTHTFTRDQVACLSLWEALALHDDAHGARTIRP